MLLPALLSLTFASSSNVSASDDDPARDTAQQAAASTSTSTSASAPRRSPSLAAVATPGAWGEVIALLRQVHGVDAPRTPICLMSQQEGYWVEVFTKSGEWKPTNRPCPSAAAALTSAPPLAELKGVQEQQLVACDVVKPWVEGAQAPGDLHKALILPPLVVAVQPVAGGR